MPVFLSLSLSSSTISLAVSIEKNIRAWVDKYDWNFCRCQLNHRAFSSRENINVSLFLIFHAHNEVISVVTRSAIFLPTLSVSPLPPFHTRHLRCLSCPFLLLYLSPHKAIFLPSLSCPFYLSYLSLILPSFYLPCLSLSSLPYLSPSRSSSHLASLDLPPFHTWVLITRPSSFTPQDSAYANNIIIQCIHVYFNMYSVFYIPKS